MDQHFGKILLGGFRQFLHEQENRSTVGLIFPDQSFAIFAMTERAGHVMGSNGKNNCIRRASDMFIKILFEFGPQFGIAETELPDDPLAFRIHGKPFRMGFEISFVPETFHPGSIFFRRDIIEKCMVVGNGSAKIVDPGRLERLCFHSRKGRHPDFFIHPISIKEILADRTVEKIIRHQAAVFERIFLFPADLRQTEIFQIGNFFPASCIIPDESAVGFQKIMHGMMDTRFSPAGQQQGISCRQNLKFPGFQFRIVLAQNDLFFTLPDSFHDHRKCGSRCLFQMDFQLVRGILQIVRSIGRQHDPVFGFSFGSQLHIGQSPAAA